MSEVIGNHHNHQPHPEQKGLQGPENSSEAQPDHEHEPKPHEPDTRHEHIEALDKINLEIEQTAESGEELKKDLAAETKQPNQPRFLNKELRQKALTDVLGRTRRHLNKPEKSLSKFIHLPLIEKVSDVAAKTVARPSGLIAAGIAALFGGITLLYVSRHYGYEYRFSAYALLLAGGFLLGILVELLFKLFRRR